MKSKKIAVADRISIIALIVNSVVAVGLAFWNIRITDRLARLEYEDYAPRVRISRVSWANEGNYYLTLSLQNIGLKDVENLHLVIDSYILYPLRSCRVRLAHNVEPQNTNDVSRVFVLYTFQRISPSETIVIDCSSPSIIAYYNGKDYSPFTVEDEKCLPKFPEHPEYSSAIPRIQVFGTNLARIDYECTTLSEGKASP